MLNICYELALLLWGTAQVPKALYQKWKLKKKGTLFSKISPDISAINDLGSSVVWVHAISLGEMKAVSPLIAKIKAAYPQIQLVFSATTETGYEFAKSHYGSLTFLLPLDLYAIQKKLVKAVNPKLFILVESDFWMNLFTHLKKNGTEIVLVNGKISDTAFKRFSKLPFFSKKLFGFFDLLVVQNQDYFSKFSALTSSSKVEIGQNLKLSKTAAPVKGALSHLKGAKVITVACTHGNEEKELLEALSPQIEAGYTILLAPRHPERFTGVYESLKALGYDISFLDEGKDTKIILMNKMGMLNECYAVSTYAVSAGSFSSQKGGHDIFEPILQGVPTLFGPHMHAQRSFLSFANDYSLGFQVEEKNLSSLIEQFDNTTDFHAQFQERLKTFKHEHTRAVDETFKLLENKCEFFRKRVV